MSYKLLIGNRNNKDSERAVLPTIMYAKKSAEDHGCYKITCRAIVIGWWAWGIGVMKTTVTEQ